MKEIFLIVKKELKELFRDKKTMFNSILLPTLMLPILILIMVNVGKQIQKKNKTKVVSIGLVNTPKAFQEILEKDSTNRTIVFPTEENFKILIEKGTIQTAIIFPKNWFSIMDLMGTAEVKIIKNSSKGNVNRRLSKALNIYNNQIKAARMGALNIPKEKLNPLKRNYVEVGEKKEVLGKKIGGFVPYIFILTMWGGCLLACIDLVTGEKERKTIETTLLLPISKFKILMGKTIVASLLGLIPATLNLIGLVVGLKFVKGIPEEFKEALSAMLSLESVLLVLCLLVPFALFLSSIIMLLIAGASSFKEAQSKATPIIILIILPLVVAMMPGVDFTWSTVFIPVLNIGLGVKEIMAGTIDYFKYATVLVSLIVFAVSGIYFSFKKFSNENSILN